MLFRWHIRYYIFYFDWLIHTIFSTNYMNYQIIIGKIFSWIFRMVFFLQLMYLLVYFFCCNFCFHRYDINGHELNDKNSSDSLCILKIGSNVCFSQNIIKLTARKMIIIISFAMLPKNKTVSIIWFSVFFFSFLPNKLKWQGNTKREHMN